VGGKGVGVRRRPAGWGWFVEIVDDGPPYYWSILVFSTLQFFLPPPSLDSPGTFI